VAAERVGQLLHALVVDRDLGMGHQLARGGVAKTFKIDQFDVG
jgi:hypothetical protein